MHIEIIAVQHERIVCEQLHRDDRVPFDAGLAQKMSDRAVRVIQATEAGELLPRAFAEASHFECKFCSYAQRCWGGA